jgi:hypothetical protein
VSRIHITTKGQVRYIEEPCPVCGGDSLCQVKPESGKYTIVYMVFGTASGDDTHLRHDYVEQDRVWPPSEVTNGVGTISVESYGDSPRSWYLRVYGLDKEACKRTYVRTAKALNIERWWSEVPRESDGDRRAPVQPEPA